MSTAMLSRISQKIHHGHQKRERLFRIAGCPGKWCQAFHHKLIHPFSAPENDPTHEEFWALKDINLDTCRVTGLASSAQRCWEITLLKVLSRITGAVLWEDHHQGTRGQPAGSRHGFHPELTVGRIFSKWRHPRMSK